MCFSFQKTPKELDRYDSSGRTYILSAAFVYQLDIVLELLDAGANPSLPEKDSLDGLLHFLAKTREPEDAAQFAILKKIVTGALFKGLSPDAQNALGMSALHCAVRSGSYGMVAMLLQHGAAPNLRDSAGETPLHLCVSSKLPGFCSTATLLVSSGADPNALDDGGISPLLFLQAQPAPQPKEVRDLIARMMARNREPDSAATAGIEIVSG